MRVSYDQNHFKIVNGLRSAGFCVMDNADAGGGRLDIITSKRNFPTVCIEIKFGDSAVFKRSQLKFLSEWEGYCGYAKDFAFAYKLASEPEKYALTEKQQRQIKVWLYKNEHVDQILVSTFEAEVFGIGVKQVKKSHNYDVYIVTVKSSTEKTKVFSHTEKLNSKASKKALDQIKLDVKMARYLKPNQSVEIEVSSRL